MKFDCFCGAQVFDGGDALPHKAHLIPDQAWLALLDALDARVLAPLAGNARRLEAASMAARSLLIGAARLAYQCHACGRLYVDDRQGVLQCYEPASPETDRQVLRGRRRP